MRCLSNGSIRSLDGANNNNIPSPFPIGVDRVVGRGINIAIVNISPSNSILNQQKDFDATTYPVAAAGSHRVARTKKRCAHGEKKNNRKKTGGRRWNGPDKRVGTPDKNLLLL